MRRPRLAKQASGEGGRKTFFRRLAIKTAQDCRKQVAPPEPTGEPDGAPAHVRVGMTGQSMQARSRIDAMMPESRQPKAA
ncbi:MAG: hypothetical protein E5W21_29545 [Mesorhizobium sp.]|nr:MAG: hypothetical protein E5W21_29545 [Mesorhizobium sp.]